MQLGAVKRTFIAPDVESGGETLTFKVTVANPVAILNRVQPILSIFNTDSPQ
jgi:hypothetical protein